MMKVMENTKKKPGSLTDAEKHLILQMKQELIMAGVPKEEIPRYIQQELTMHRQEQKNASKMNLEPSKNSPIRNVLNKIKNHALKIGQKILQKTIFRSMMNQNGQPFDLGQSEMDLPLFRPDDPDWESEVNKHSSSLQPDTEKKRIIVDMDDEDDE